MNTNHPDIVSPLDQMSLHMLTFLVERTDFSEPWMGIGFASQAEKELKDALERKKSCNNKARLDGRLGGRHQ